MTLRRVLPWKTPLSATSAEPLFAGVSDWGVQGVVRTGRTFRFNANVAAKQWFFTCATDRRRWWQCADK